MKKIFSFFIFIKVLIFQEKEFFFSKFVICFLFDCLLLILRFSGLKISFLIENLKILLYC